MRRQSDDQSPQGSSLHTALLVKDNLLRRIVLRQVPRRLDHWGRKRDDAERSGRRRSRFERLRQRLLSLQCLLEWRWPRRRRDLGQVIYVLPEQFRQFAIAPLLVPRPFSFLSPFGYLTHCQSAPFPQTAGYDSRSASGSLFRPKNPFISVLARWPPRTLPASLSVRWYARLVVLLPADGRCLWPFPLLAPAATRANEDWLPLAEMGEAVVRPPLLESRLARCCA
jgi:hypothetical protein